MFGWQISVLIIVSRARDGVWGTGGAALGELMMASAHTHSHPHRQTDRHDYLVVGALAQANGLSPDDQSELANSVSGELGEGCVCP